MKVLFVGGNMDGKILEWNEAPPTHVIIPAIGMASISHEAYRRTGLFTETAHIYSHEPLTNDQVVQALIDGYGKPLQSFTIPAGTSLAQPLPARYFKELEGDCSNIIPAKFNELIEHLKSCSQNKHTCKFSFGKCVECGRQADL